MNRDEIENLWNLAVDKIEAIPLLLATRIGPWLTPSVPAFFVHKAMIKNLETPYFWAWTAAISLEVVGLASVYSLLRAYQWNREKRKSDPEAPIGWNVITTAVYYLTALALVLFIEFYPDVVKFAPAAFVVLSGTSAAVLALIGDQQRRERQIEVSKERKIRVKFDKEILSKDSVKNGDFTSINEARKQEKEARLTALLDIYLDNPQVGVSAIAQTLGVTRQTVYNDLNELEQSGAIHRNGQGVKVL